MQNANHLLKKSMEDVIDKYWKKKIVYKERYKPQEEALVWLFENAEKNLSGTLIKVISLNDFYSTRIFNKDIGKVAQLILDGNFDERIREEKNPAVVNELAEAIKSETRRRSYSFATKYCSFCKSDVYPICDSHVIDKLSFFNEKIRKFSKFTKKEIWENYVEFHKVVMDFRKAYGLEKAGVPLKEMDEFLWVSGREDWKFVFEGEKITAKR